MNAKLNVVIEKADPIKRAAGFLSTMLNNNYPSLLLASGGSALGILDHISMPTKEHQLFIGVLDERLFVPGEDRNEIGLRNVLNLRNKNNKISILSVPQRVEKGEIANAYEKKIRQWIYDYPHGQILASLGMGPDGHTAGIFPDHNQKAFEEKFDKGDHWFVVHEVDEEITPWPIRLTATFPLLRQLTGAVMLILGEKKKKNLERLLENKSKPEELPASIIYEMQHTVLVTDINVGA